MATNHPIKVKTRRTIPALAAVSIVLGLMSPCVNADEMMVRTDLKSEGAVASWPQAFVGTPPSADFVAALAGGVLVALALLYLSRRTRLDEPPMPGDFGGAPANGAAGTYRVTVAWKAGIVLFAGIFLLGSLVGCWAFGVIAETRGTPLSLFLVFLLAIVASGTAFYMVDTLVSKIVLKTDRLEIHELWRVRRVLRANIETRQVLHPPNSPAVLLLRLKAPSNRKIKLPMMWNMDSTWQTWFAAIPDVDADAAKTFEAEIAANTDLGTTPAERQQKLGTARSVARIATWANSVLVVWAFAYPHPYALVIVVVALLPWVAVWIMARSPGIYTINAPRGSGRPDLTIMIIAPGLLLMLRAMQDVQILDWQRLLPGAVLVSMILMGSVLWAVPPAREKRGMVLLTLLFLMAYGYGAVALADSMLDRSTGASYPTTVYGKYVTSGRNRTPKLQLEPWGPRAARDDVRVPWDLYRSTSVGETVCVVLHPGAFAVRWYRIAKCQLK